MGHMLKMSQCNSGTTIFPRVYIYISNDWQHLFKTSGLVERGVGCYHTTVMVLQKLVSKPLVPGLDMFVFASMGSFTKKD